jgi:hypothetical protein
MSIQIMLILVGALLILIGIVGGLKRGAKNTELVDAKVRIPLGVAGMFILIFVGYYLGAIKPVGPLEHIDVGHKLKIEYPVNKTQVVSPIDGDQVECRILTMGVYPEGLNKDIWVLLKPTDNRYYPQSDHTNVSYKRNGKWQVITRFGGDAGENYELIVYETDAAANKFFSSTIQRWKDQLSYPGLELEEIPASAVEVERLNISLKGNCRGVF